MIRRHPTTALVVSLAVLAAVVLASLALGSQPLSPSAVLHALAHPHSTDSAARIVNGLRTPRTAVGLAAGLSLGIAGALMQGVTRNPLADPGLLGVNAGAALAVVVSIAFFGITSASGYVWFAFAGAAAAAVLVYAIGTGARGAGAAIRLTITGAAITAAITSLVNLVLLSRNDVFAQFRFWSLGSISNRDLGTVGLVLPFIAVGVLLAAIGGRMLNLLALGEDTARGLGQNVVLARVICAVAVVLLAGSATSLAGPLVFVGLVAAHAARALAGADYRWIIALAAVIGPVLLLAADVVGRFIAPPGELEAGIVVALIGAPVMIALVRRPKLVGA